tara:strand:- start:19 stop:621 length:603 start_codon:yes stop_codon:yes gene_type:complete
VLILASASQSRKNLLVNSGIDFFQFQSSFNEKTIKNDCIQDLSLELASAKANSILNKILEIDLKTSSFKILGCDSIFEFKGKAYGKPVDKNQAYQRWVEMSSNHGFLHTGHCLLFCDLKENEKTILIRKEVKKVISTKIFFSKLNDEEIKEYINSLEPLNCAGGFALEGIGGKYINKIEGCVSNVMGLSLPWLREELLKE